MSSLTLTINEREAQEQFGGLYTENTGELTHVEIRELGQVIIHGYELDLRGADAKNEGKKRISASIRDLRVSTFYHTSGITLEKHEDGTYHLEYTNVIANGGTPADPVVTTHQESDIPVYPVWPTGEAQAPQRIRHSHPGNVVPVPPETIEELKARLQPRIGEVADNFTAQLNAIHHLPHIETKQDDVCLDLTKHTGNNLTTQQEVENNAIEKYDNAANWGRSWIGHVWKSVDTLTAQSTDKAKEDAEALVETLETELAKLTPKQFYMKHSRAQWTGWHGSRKIYKYNTTNGGRDGNAVHTAADAAEWTDLLMVRYPAALAHDV